MTAPARWLYLVGDSDDIIWFSHLRRVCVNPPIAFGCYVWYLCLSTSAAPGGLVEWVSPRAAIGWWNEEEMSKPSRGLQPLVATGECSLNEGTPGDTPVTWLVSIVLET